MCNLLFSYFLFLLLFYINRIFKITAGLFYVQTLTFWSLLILAVVVAFLCKICFQIEYWKLNFNVGFEEVILDITESLELKVVQHSVWYNREDGGLCAETLSHHVINLELQVWRTVQTKCIYSIYTNWFDRMEVHYMGIKMSLSVGLWFLVQVTVLHPQELQRKQRRETRNMDEEHVTINIQCLLAAE